MGHERVAADLVLVGHVGQAALHEVGEERRQVAGVELAGVRGHVGGEIGRPENGHAIDDDGLVGA